MSSRDAYFRLAALHLKKGNLHLKRICSATENETLSPLKTLYFFSLYLMPHIKNRSPPYKKRSLGSYGGSLL